MKYKMKYSPFSAPTHDKNELRGKSNIMQARKLPCLWKDCDYKGIANELYEHCIEHLGSPQNESFECLWNFCEFTTTKYHGLKSHIGIHIPYKPFKCEICDRPFKRKFDMKKHIKAIHLKGIDDKLID